jgi:MFS family permease
MHAPVPPAPLPVGPVLAVTTATQALSTLGALALAAVAPSAARDLGVSPALIGYQVGLVFFGAMLSASIAGGLVMRHGPVRTSQLSLALIASGCLVSTAGTLSALVAGAFAMGLGYGIPNPAASQLLARVPSQRRMNLLFSIKQTGVPIGGVLSGVLVPPLTLALGWQAALAICALLLAALAVTIGTVRREWDTERREGVPVFASALQSVALVWRHKPLRWLAGASFLYSGVQLCLTGFLVTYLVGDIGLTLVVAGTVLSTTHAAGAAGRLAWGWLADRLGSGGLALILNGACAAAGALLTAAIAPHWPLAAVIAASAAFGFCAMGWNGVYIAVIARQSPPGSIGLATGGSLSVTYAGVIVTPPAFAALHDHFALSYGSAFALLSLVTALGIACVVLARRAAISLRARAPTA